MSVMDIEEIQSFISKVPLFEGLMDTDCYTICKAMVVREFTAGETIVHEEDRNSNTFFVIGTGKVHVTVLTPEGKQTILATLHKGDFFGEMSLLDGEPRSASVISAEPCRLFVLYRPAFFEILEKFPHITIRLLVTMSRRIRHSNRQINTLSMMSVYGRVADVILQLAREQGKRTADMVIIPNPPTHQTIAEMAGTSRETVSRIFSQLRKKHLIITNRKRLVVLNEEKLYD